VPISEEGLPPLAVSKYPPAKPGALGLEPLKAAGKAGDASPGSFRPFGQAPGQSLILHLARPSVEQTFRLGHRGRSLRVLGSSEGRLHGGVLLETSNLYCHPGRAGGTPFGV
jgi:hypothetical protein